MRRGFARSLDGILWITAGVCLYAGIRSPWGIPARDIAIPALHLDHVVNENDRAVRYAWDASNDQDGSVRFVQEQPPTTDDPDPLPAPEEPPPPDDPSLVPPVDEPMENRIVFSFSKTPWDVALTRFAELADLQLILKFKPPGTFDYTSSKAYTIPEALDVLNEVLFAEGFVVLRTDRFLTLAALDQPLPLSQVPTVEEDQLVERGRNEFVTVIRRLQFADPATIEEPLKGLLSRHGMLQVVPSLKLLRITDQVAKLEEVLPLIKELDEAAKPKPSAPPKAAEPKVRKSLPLKHLSPERAMALIKSVLGVSGVIEPGPDGTSLILVLTEGEHAQIADFLAEIDQPTSVDDQPGEKSFPLRSAKAESVMGVLRSLYPDDKEGVSIAADGLANVVAVKAPGGTMKQIEALVASLEEQAEKNQPTQEVYRPGGDLTSLLTQLQVAFSVRSEPNISIALGADGQSLLVIAPAETQKRIRDAIEKLTGTDAGDDPAAVTVVPLEHASAQTLATTLANVFPSTLPGVSIGSDVGANAIVIRGHAPAVERIARVIKELDLPPAVMGLREKEEAIYEPKNAKPDELINAAESLYPTTTNVVLVPTAGNKIMISAPPVLMPKVKGTLDLIDQASAAKPAPTDRAYMLRHADPAELIATLTTIFPPDEVDARFIPDNAHRRIFIVAVDDDIHRRIAEMINQLDVPTETSESIEIYTPQNAAARDLIPQLTSMFSSDSSSPAFQLHRDGRSVMIRATRGMQAKIAEFLAKIDIATDMPEALPIDRIYKLKFADAASMVEALGQLFPTASTAVSITAEPTNNLLIIKAPADVHERIKAILEQVDVPTDTRMELRLYRSDQVTPANLASLVSQMSYKGVGTMVASPDGRQLIAMATPEGHKSIQSLVDAMNVAEGTDVERKTYPVQNIAASSMVSMLQTFFPASGPLPATVAADPSGKNVFVQAPPAVQVAVAELIKQADVPSPLEEFTVKAKHVTVVSLYTQIYGLFGGVDGTRVTYDTGSNTVGVNATPAMRERIESFAESFDQPIDPETGRVREVYKMTHITASAGYSAVVALFPQSETNVIATYENANQLVIATATKEQHQQIKEELDRIDVDPRANWETVSIRPIHTGASELLTFLNTQLAAVANKSVSLGSHGRDVIVNAPPEVIAEVDRLAKVFDVEPPVDDGRVRKVYRPTYANASYLAINLQTAFPTSRRVDVTADPYSATVTVVAPEVLHAEIAALVEQIDKDPKGKWVEKSLTPKHVPADQIIQWMTTALAGESNKTLTASGDRVVVLAPPTVMERIEKLFATLDVAPTDEGQSVAKSYMLKYAYPPSVYTILSQVFPPATSGVKLYYDSTNRSVTVVGKADIHVQAKELIDTMDVDPNANREQRILVPKNVPASSLVTLLQGALSTEPGASAALGPGGQSVVVFASADSMPRIEQYFQELDANKAAQTTRKLYTMKYATAYYLVSTLQSLYPPTEYPVVVSADARNNVLVVQAPDDVQIKIAELLKQLDAPQDGKSQSVYRLEHTRAATILPSLETFVSGTGTTVVAGPDDKSLVVNALPEQHEKVKGFLSNFDQAENAQDPVSQVYSLRFADASEMYRMINQLFRTERNLQVTYDTERNTLLVTAPPNVLEQVAQVVNDADQEGVNAKFQSEVFRLSEASANDTARALTAAFPDPKKATFVADSDTRTVLVRAQPALLEEIRRTIELLDKPPQRSQKDLAVFDLFRVDPFDASAIVAELFDDLSRDQRPMVETTYEPPRLIVRASTDQIDEIRTILSRLEGTSVGDVADPGNPSPAPDRPLERVIRLNDADPASTIESIRQSWPLLRRNPLNIVVRKSPLDLIEPPGEKPAGESQAPPPADDLPGDPNLAVTVIVGNDRLTATSRDADALDLLQSLTEAWTEPFDPDRSASRIFYVQNADAEEIARAIDEAFNGRESNNDNRRRFRPERVRVVAEPNANALIVRASAVDLVNVKQLIDSLDVTPETASLQRIIPLKQADAAEVLTVIQEVFADYLVPGSGPPISVPGVRAQSTRSRAAAMRVDVDARSNSLIVSAPETVMADLEELIRGLEEAASSSTKSYRVVPIQNASPADVRNALEILLDRQLQGGSSSRSTPSRRSRSTRTRTRTSSAILPENAAERSIASKTIGQDGQTQVTTIGSPRNGQRGDMIRPGAAPWQEGSIILASAEEPEDAEADSLMAADAAPVGPISGSVDVSVLDEIGALLLLGTDKDLAILSDVIAEIERISKSKELSFELYPLEHAKAAAIADLLNELQGRLLDARGTLSRAQGQASVIPLSKPNAILLVAPKDELPSFVELAKRFDLPADPATTFRVFRLKHARSQIIAQTIENFYNGRQQEGELATELIVESDDRSNTLIVYAGPSDMEEIARLIEELDTAKTARINELKIFYLKHTVATELSTTLESAIQTGQVTTGAAANRGRGIPGLEIPDPEHPEKSIGSGILEGVQITPNRRANALIVSAPKDVMAMIETLIQQLDVLPEAVAEIKVFALVNSDAVTMVQTLRGLFAQLQTDQNQVAVTAGLDVESNPLVELTFSIDERTNSILVSGTRQQLEVVEAIVLRLDASDVEDRRTDIYRLKNAPAADVAQALTELLSQQQQISGIQEGQSLQQQLEREVIVVPEQISNSLLISASPRFYTHVIELIEKLDALPPQVVIQVLLAEVQLDGDAELGVELGLQDGLLFQRSNQNANLQNSTNTYFNDGSTPGFNFNSGGPLGDNIFSGQSSQVAGQGLSNFAVGRANNTLGFGGLVLSASSESVSILLRALARERRLEVLSRPQIMTLDNQQATIVVGAEVPRITGSNLVQGAGVTQSIEYVPSGIILEVLPKINPDGTIVMQVSPEISRLSAANNSDANVTIAPGVVARALEITRAVTTVSTEDGQTVVLGGLIRKSTEKEERKVPYLGDIPVAGHLFRYDRLTERRSELLIIMTPHIVYSRADAERIKAVEAARMNWCLSDVEALHGDLDLPTEVYLDDVAGQPVLQEPYAEEYIIDEDSVPPEEEMLLLPEPADSTLLPPPTGPTEHHVAKPPASKNTPEGSVDRPAIPNRKEARSQRAERDAKIYETPMQTRRRQFDDWKNRNLPWRRSPQDKEPAKKP